MPAGSVARPHWYSPGWNRLQWFNSFDLWSPPRAAA